MLSYADRAAWVWQPVAVETVTAPADYGAFTIADLRDHTHQPLSHDDRTLQQLMAAAQVAVEARLGRPLLAQTRRAWFDAVPGPVIRLSEPATAIASVKAYTTADVEQAVASTVYQADVASQPARLFLRAGQSWPSGLRTRLAMAVEYAAGWAPTEMPENVRLAVLQLVAHWYENPQPVAVGQTVAEIPLGIDLLLQRHCLALGVA